MEKRKWEKTVPFQKLSGKKNLEKKNKKKSPPDFIGKKVPVGRSTGNNFFIVGWPQYLINFSGQLANCQL